ncbi:molybdenum cofactor guanylyltransferase [Salipaludibacillus daqingensis]|uniref:molybdenum cofactor guanylyltransferase n=1 Tax=Salipaludibacillus daqingensis TaxID=3041001 RepID=UPI002475ADCE|nr:molybdenum cofactor guanylyltransferase [Salipaludibacillus daqingensis]
MELTGILLAGGKSSRMGTNKAFLVIEGERNIVRLKRKIERITKVLLLVTNDPQNFSFLELPMIEDIKKGQGPLAGMEAGLTTSQTDWNLIVACDLPFFDEKVVHVLIEKAKAAPEAQAIVPVIDGREHPLYALYHKSALRLVEENLSLGKRRIRDVLSQLRVEAITTDDLLKAKMTDVEIEKAFFNMNHPEDYKWANSQNFE